MRKEDLFASLSQVEEEMLKQHDLYEEKLKRRKRRSGFRYGALTSVAAVLVVLVLAMWNGVFSDDIRDGGNGPLLTIQSDAMDGMGFEGLIAEDFSLLKRGDVWIGDSPEDYLPVLYSEGTYEGEGGIPVGHLSRSEMLIKAKEVAELLQVEYTSKEERTLSLDPKTVYALYCKSKELSVEIGSDGSVYVRYEKPLDLDYASFATEEDVVDFLLEKYKGIHGFSHPKAAVETDYNIYGEKNVYYIGYDEGEDVQDKLINYRMNRIQFWLDDNLCLVGVWFDPQTENTSFFGSYPTISVKEAKKLFEQGVYFSTEENETPSVEEIAATELVYTNYPDSHYIWPMYRFWVRLPSYDRENGLKTYAAYYVPAIEKKYWE